MSTLGYSLYKLVAKTVPPRPLTTSKILCFVITLYQDDR
jgi:hypothetical protein